MVIKTSKARNLSGSGDCGQTIDGPALVDAHVHYHRCFDYAAFFASAAANFERAVCELGVGPGWVGCLLLTESAGERFFDNLRGPLGSGDTRWQVRATDEDCSLVLVGDAGVIILIVAGRQIVTAEGIEVLALATSAKFDDGDAFAATVDAVIKSGAVAALPWGFGKWWFRRGRLVRQMISELPPKRIFLGDNGGRLGWGPRPALFERAQHRGIVILPGSDPLPFAGEVAKVGGYGLELVGPIDLRMPTDSVKRALGKLTKQPRTFGRLEAVGAFCRNQVMMQLSKCGPAKQR